MSISKLEQRGRETPFTTPDQLIPGQPNLTPDQVPLGSEPARNAEQAVLQGKRHQESTPTKPDKLIPGQPTVAREPAKVEAQGKSPVQDTPEAEPPPIIDPPRRFVTRAEAVELVKDTAARRGSFLHTRPNEAAVRRYMNNPRLYEADRSLAPRFEKAEST